MRISATVISGLVAVSSVAAAQTRANAPTAAPSPQAQPPLTVIAPRTTNQDLGPRTLHASIVACIDLPTTAVPVQPLHIVAAQSGDTHLVYRPGEIVVLNGGTPEGLAVGQRYFTRRLQLGIFAQPPTPVTPGAIRTSGWLTVIAADERFALARIDYACDEVAAGDYLEPYAEPALPATVAAGGAPNFSDMGRVMFGSTRRESFAAGDVANIDRGKLRGIGVGTRVAFYRDRMNGTPLVEIGEGVVVEVSDETSKVVLTRSRDAVLMGDYVVILGTPAPPPH